jgi:polygalacturonase
MRLAILVLAVTPVVAQDTRTVTEPVFPPVCTQVPALSTAGDSSLDTTRIQAALNSCPAGEAVELRADGPSTAFFIGPIQLPPGVTLLLDVGVTVFGSRNPRDYDSSSARTCGTITTANTGCFPLITANRADGAGIMGYGTIDGRGHLPMLIDGAPASQSWWDLANAANTGSLSQNCPRMIQVSNTNGFTLHKVTLKNSPNFHVALGTDTNFTAWGIKIITPYDARNTDGIDPGYSNNVTITQCHISDGDDNVAVGGSNSPGASNISVVNNFFGDGHGASIGSYTQAGVSNILFDHITFAGNKANGSATGIRIKSDVSRGGLVQNITYSNMCLQNVRAAIVLDPFYTSGATGSLIPQYKNITIQNVRSTTESTVKVEGHDAANNTTVTLNNVQIDGIKSTDITEQYVEYTLGPDPVNFAAFLKGTGVTVTNNISTSNTAYACPDAVFAPVAAELLPGPSLMFAGFPFFLTAQIYTTKAVPYQTWLANLKTDPNATLALPAPTGALIINDGNNTVGSASLGAGQFVPIFIPWLSPGLHTLTASYTGDANYPPFTFGSYSVFVFPLWWLPALAELR